MKTNNLNKSLVYGKEFVLTKSIIKRFLRTEFKTTLNIQDIWLEEGDVHFRLAGISKNKSNLILENSGFKKITDSFRYDANEILDKKFIQLFQERNILNYTW